MRTLDGILFAGMIRSGAANLKAHAKEVNDLNVFPIPDGDTGDNMLMTVMGGVLHGDEIASLSNAADHVAGGMLLSARGNSGVILSQFFDGIKTGFAGLDTADRDALGEAFRCGVTQAYRSVMTPTEGTILTVVREATEYACSCPSETPEEFLRDFIEEAKRSLERTPNLLAVLKKAGVVDSGAAGLIYIAEGMLQALSGNGVSDFSESNSGESAPELDLNAFDENSVLEFGYCTELLLRLQRIKTDVEAFDVNVVTEYLQTIGDSIVAFKNGTLIKIHVHTKTPQKVLEFCQNYGEFLKVKIENMSLQHNNTVLDESTKKTPPKERKPYGVVAVASGDGLKQTFLDRGADVVVDGGQSMNPSAEDFIAAFDAVNAEVIFVFPNNGNIVLTANQAARLYTDSDVRVIESTTIGAGYASLSMLDTGMGDTDAIVQDLNSAMEGVITAEISHCVRDAVLDGCEMHVGDYIGFAGKELLSVHPNRLEAVCETLKKIGMEQYDICIAFCGKDVDEAEVARLETELGLRYKGKEFYLINGGQDVYDYILIVE